MRQLITSGAVPRPAQLLAAAPRAALLGGGAAPAANSDPAALAQRAFADAPAPPGAQLARVVPPGGLTAARSGGAVYNRAIGVDPAARPRLLSASEAAEASGARITATAFRNLALPD